ncbi:MAG: hypothetical protein DMD48_09320 [Gemmatimonadetes bacterium]|nr:MAG: hypothetical protein DMD48_09320 [Gemmatimonadota bacterium]
MGVGLQLLRGAAGRDPQLRSQRRHARRAQQCRISGDLRRQLAHRRRDAGRPRARGDLDRRRRAGARRRRPALHDPSAATGRSLTGLHALPSSSLSARTVAFLQTGGGPAASLAIVRDVLGIAQANRHTADRIAAALLAPDPRFVRTADGRWTLATAPPEASPALDACRWAVVDVETTGVRAFSGDRIIEIAVVMLDGSVAFHSLVNPGIPTPPFVQGLTGIVPSMLSRAPFFADIAEPLLAALDGCVFVAHNARFDWAFVSTEMHRATGDAVAAAKCLAKLLRLAEGNGASTLAALNNL